MTDEATRAELIQSILMAVAHRQAVTIATTPVAIDASWQLMSPHQAVTFERERLRALSVPELRAYLAGILAKDADEAVIH
jgi:hypothetical protein